MQRVVLVFSFLLLLGITYSQDFKEYNHAAIISFEEPDSRTSHDAHSTLTITSEHYKHLSSSLKWSWSSVDSYWSIRDEVAYTAPLTDSAPASAPLFSGSTRKSRLQTGTLRWNS